MSFHDELAELQKTSDECRKAWFEYKAFVAKHYPGTTLQVTTFVAGWNMAKKASQRGHWPHV